MAVFDKTKQASPIRTFEAGTRPSASHLNELRDALIPGQAFKPHKFVGYFPAEKMSFYVTQLSGTTARVKGGGVLIGTTEHTVVDTGITFTGAVCYVYLKLPKPSGTLSIEVQSSTSPVTTADEWRWRLQLWTATDGVYNLTTIFRLGDRSFDLPLLP